MPKNILKNLDGLTPDESAKLLELERSVALDDARPDITNNFLSFVKYVWPEFIEGSHHKIINKKFNDIATGKIKRLIINMPPRHTKSEFASYLLPAWMIGKNPKLKIIQATHTADLAIDFGRKTKNLVDEPRYRSCFQRDYKKIVRQQGNGKRNKGENTLQLVLVVQSLEGVLTY
jgi:hypothetical protein